MKMQETVSELDLLLDKGYIKCRVFDYCDRGLSDITKLYVR